MALSPVKRSHQIVDCSFFTSPTRFHPSAPFKLMPNKEENKTWQETYHPTSNLLPNSDNLQPWLPTWQQQYLIHFNRKNSLVLYKASIETLPTPFDLKVDK